MTLKVVLWVVGGMVLWLALGTAIAMTLGAISNECERREDDRRSKDFYR